MSQPDLLNLLKRLSAQPKADLIPRLLRYATEGPALLVVTANPEIYMAALRDPAVEQLLRLPRTLAIADGIGVVKALRYKLRRQVPLIPGIELAEALVAETATKPLRAFLYGARPEVLDALVASWRTAYPNLEIVGAYPGFGQDEDHLRTRILETAPDLVFVALGCPRQERFLASLLDDLPHGLLMGLGGAFDVLSGHKARAPKAFRRLHLEWAYRLLREPARLPRFLRGQVAFMFKVLCA